MFENEEKGMVLNLEKQLVKIVLFGSERDISQGHFVFRTQEIVSIRVGDLQQVPQHRGRNALPRRVVALSLGVLRQREEDVRWAPVLGFCMCF